MKSEIYCEVENFFELLNTHDKARKLKNIFEIEKKALFKKFRNLSLRQTRGQ
jgi:hypothetical protein